MNGRYGNRGGQTWKWLSIMTLIGGVIMWGWVERVLGSGGDADAAFQDGIRSFLETVDYEQSLPHFRRALKIDPDHRDASYQLIDYLFRLERPEEAMSLLKTHLEKFPADDTAWYLLGRHFYEKKDWKMARQAYQRAIKENPRSIAALLALGGAEQHLDNPQAAIASYEAYLQWQPGDDFALARIAECREALGDPGGAVEQYIASLREDPESLVVPGQLLAALQKAGRFAEVEKTAAGIPGLMDNRMFLDEWAGMLEGAGDPAAAVAPRLRLAAQIVRQLSTSDLSAESREYLGSRLKTQLDHLRRDGAPAEKLAELEKRLP